jgi:predicted MPP superfamily phosphohydrolase
MAKRGLPKSSDRSGRAGAPQDPSRRRVLKAFVAGGIGATTGVAGYGFLYERHQLEITTTDVAVSGLPHALDGLRIALVTDTHFSRTVAPEDVERAVRGAMAARPDLIVLGGDYVTWGDRAYVSGAADLLAPLQAPHGVFAVLGNHDDDRDMPAALTSKGFAVLKDARTRIVVRGEPLEIAGIRFWTRRIEPIANLLRGAKGTVILLSHDPRRLSEAASLDVPLVLSGHTHGGQIVLPVAGAVAARRFPVVAGVARRENTSIYVSRGVGTVYVPLRLNCPPEVAIVQIRRLADF